MQLVVPALSLSDEFYLKLRESAIAFIPRFIFAFILIIFGWWFIKILMRILTKVLMLRPVDLTLKQFISSLLGVFLKVLLFITVAGVLGITTASLVTVIGAAGLAIGLALQGSLSNFAGGMLILFFKPFKVGDYIKAQNYQGKVVEIQVLYTILNADDNRKIVIPNGNLSNNGIENFTANDLRMINIFIYIDHSNDLLKAINLLQKLIAEETRVAPDTTSEVMVKEVSEKGIKLNINLWVTRQDFFVIQSELWQKIKLKFDLHHIQIPPKYEYPQYNRTE